jgi:hypothetical protein
LLLYGVKVDCAKIFGGPKIQNAFCCGRRAVGRPALLVLPGRFRRARPKGAGRAATEGRKTTGKPHRLTILPHSAGSRSSPARCIGQHSR